MKKIIYCLLLLVVFNSCKREENAPNNNDDVATKIGDNNGNIVLGKKLENPYSVKNMKKAYQSLAQQQPNSANKSFADENAITTTHYYVRFLPTDSIQYNKLKADGSLVLYPIPLDYEIIDAGCNTQEPSDKPVWQYTAVKKTYQFDPTIKYEILEDLYLPEESSTGTISTLSDGSKSTYANKLTGDLVNESMKMTNNLKDISDSGAPRKVLYRPAGRITVFDTRLNKSIPLAGVEIRGRRWFNFKSTYTDANGNYSLGYFGGNTNLSIFYETGAFDVRSGTLGQAWYNGPHTNDPWSFDIRDGVQRFYAHVFRGAFRYHNGNIGDLKRPNYGGKIKYCAYDKNNDDINGDASPFGYSNHLGILPDIRIFRYSNNIEHLSDEIFSTTVHETAHFSHIELMNWNLLQFQQVSNRIAESWAVAVQWQITSMEYKDRGITDFGNPNFVNTNVRRLRYGYQYWNSDIGSDYTSLFINLVDNFNENGAFFPLYNITGNINDNVSGYSLGSIESFLKHCYGISSTREQLKSHKPINVSDDQIDLLLNNY